MGNIIRFEPTVRLQPERLSFHFLCRQSSVSPSRLIECLSCVFSAINFSLSQLHSVWKHVCLAAKYSILTKMKQSVAFVDLNEKSLEKSSSQQKGLLHCAAPKKPKPKLNKKLN